MASLPLYNTVELSTDRKSLSSYGYALFESKVNNLLNNSREEMTYRKSSHSYSSPINNIFKCCIPFDFLKLFYRSYLMIMYAQIFIEHEVFEASEVKETCTRSLSGI